MPVLGLLEQVLPTRSEQSSADPVFIEFMIVGLGVKNKVIHIVLRHHLPYDRRDLHMNQTLSCA